MNVLSAQQHNLVGVSEWDNEYSPRDLALIFFQLKSDIFGIPSFSIDASLKKPRIYKCFYKLSESIKQWKKEGLNVNIGDYFKALFDVFGKNTFPTHCLAECGLNIYLNYTLQQIKSAPELSSEERLSYREVRIRESMANFSISRDEVLARFGAMLPDI